MDKRALALRDSLLNGEIDATALQAMLLSSPTITAQFMQIAYSKYAIEPLANIATGFDAIAGSALARGILVNSNTALSCFAASDYATEQLCKSSNAAHILLEILNCPTDSKFLHWRNNTSNYARIKQWINADDSKLKRQIFTTSGTWNDSLATIVALSASSGGGGGSGGSNNTASSDGAGGAGGGELCTIHYPAGYLDNINNGHPISVVVGTGGLSHSEVTSSDGSDGNSSLLYYMDDEENLEIHLWSRGGEGGKYSGVGGLGGGSTPISDPIEIGPSFYDWPLMTDIDFKNAAWQFTAKTTEPTLEARMLRQRGGDGGSYIVTPQPGGDGVPDGGGDPSFTTLTRAKHGRRYGSGGGCGLDTLANSYGDIGDGVENISTGGPGTRNQTALKGSDGFVVIHWMEQWW